MEEILNLPPFPPLKRDRYFWTGMIVLNAWAGFQSRQGAYASVDSRAASDGSVSLSVVTPENEHTLPSSEQAAACQHLVEQQEVTRDAILRAVFVEYPKLRACHKDFL